ncbi:MAG TPA: hypothetical protein VJ599_00860 [Nitrososphaeraceae archaeon]|nr:hypothetical protein [Nitrososphaeraceae archaeon]
MTPTLPDGWMPLIFRPITAEDDDRNDDIAETIDKIERLSPVPLTRSPNFYNKD